VGLLAGEDTLGDRRARAETALAADLLERLEPGDLLLLDGALHARTTEMAALLDRAGEREVSMVGVCKSTSLVLGGVPALAAAHLAGRAAGLPRWWAEIAAPPHVRGRVLLARLSPAEDRPFRFDVAAPDALRVLGSLASLAGHPAAPGYPSPLAIAHHAATIQEDERRRLAASVEEAALRHGAAEDAWRAAFADYHDVLDLGA
jgi:hypothetical protein